MCFAVLFRMLSVADVGQKCDLTGALDCYSELSLMTCARACDTAGKDLRSVRSELSELGDILVVDLLNLIDAESANFFA